MVQFSFNIFFLKEKFLTFNFQMITSFNPGCQTQKCPDCSPGVVYVVSRGDNDVLHYVISAIGGPPTALVIKTNKPKGRSQLNIDCKKMASKNDTERKDSITKPEGVKVLYSFGVVFSRASITRVFFVTLFYCAVRVLVYYLRHQRHLFLVL